MRSVFILPTYRHSALLSLFSWFSIGTVCNRKEQLENGVTFLGRVATQTWPIKPTLKANYGLGDQCKGQYTNIYNWNTVTRSDRIHHAGFYLCRRCGQSDSAEEPWSPPLHHGLLRNSPATMTVQSYCTCLIHCATIWLITHTNATFLNSNLDLPETNTWGWALLADCPWQRWPLKAWWPHSFLVKDADISQSVKTAVTDLTEVIFAHVSLVLYCKF